MCNQTETDDSSSGATGTVTLITRNEGSSQASLIEAYFNGNKSRMMVDTGAGASIIHHADNPEQDRIFKIRSKRTYYLPYRYDVNWREVDGNIAPTINNKTEYDELFWSSDDEDMGDTSSDDEGEDDMNKSSINEDESRLTQVKPPNNNLKNEFWSSDDEGEDMGDISSNDGDENDTYRSSINGD